MTDITEYSTKELVEELSKREGVTEYVVPPHEGREYWIEGAARVLVVID